MSILSALGGGGGGESGDGVSGEGGKGDLGVLEGKAAEESLSLAGSGSGNVPVYQFTNILCAV